MIVIQLLVEVLFYTICGWVGYITVKAVTFGKVELDWSDSSESIVTESIGADAARRLSADDDQLVLMPPPFHSIADEVHDGNTWWMTDMTNVGERNLQSLYTGGIFQCYHRLMQMIRLFLIIPILLSSGGALHGEDAGALDMHGNSPLHLAALQGRTGEVARLIQAGADVDAQNQGGETPLHKAAMNSHLDTSKVLIDRGATVDVKDGGGRTALFNAARHGGMELVKLLVAHGAHIPKHGLTPLNEAAGGGFNSSENANKRREELVEYFLAHGVDVNSPGSSAWTIGNSGATPLHAAAGRAGAGVLALLLEKGADLEALDRHGGTPLFHAARGGNSEATAFLVKQGAKPNAKDSMENTPLHVAVSSNNISECNPEVVKTLLLAGADANARDNKGRTPLHEAIGWGWDDADIVRMLLEAGANLDAKDKSGNTPRAYAEDKPQWIKLIEVWEDDHRAPVDDPSDDGNKAEPGNADQSAAAPQSEPKKDVTPEPEDEPAPR